MAVNDFTLGHEIGKRLVDAGLVPPHVCRIVIDIQCNEAVKVYYECFADKSLLNEVMDSLLSKKPLVQEVKPQAVDVTNLADEYRRHAVVIKETNL